VLSFLSPGKGHPAGQHKVDDPARAIFTTDFRAPQGMPPEKAKVPFQHDVEGFVVYGSMELLAEHPGVFRENTV
jgi:hypothetical protein